MKAISLIPIYKKYKGLWVALKSPTEIKVVAAGKDLKKVMLDAEKKGFSLPWLIQIPKKSLPIVGGFSNFQ